MSGNSKKSRNVSEYFLAIVIIGLISSAIYMYCTIGEGWSSLLWQGDTVGIFPDFFESVFDASNENPYSVGSIYPAFVYMLLKAVIHILPGKYVVANWGDYSLTRESITFISVFFSLICILYAIIILKYAHFNKKNELALILLYFCSSPMMYGEERGNLVVFVNCFVCVFLLFYDSSNTFLRIIADVCLVIATAFKIYPAILGILLIQKKQWKDVIVCIIGGLLLIILPFAYFGGFNALKAMIQNCLYLNDETVTDNRNFGYGYKISISNILNMILDYFNVENTNIASIVSVLISAMLIASVFTCKEKWKKITAATLIVVIYPTFSWMYNAIYMLAPLIMFLKERGNSKNVVDYIYISLFILIFIPLPYGHIFTSLDGVCKMSIDTFACAISLFVLTFVLIIDGTITLIKRLNIKKPTTISINEF